MFPFLNNNGHQQPFFSYNNCYEAYQQSHSEGNSVIYPFVNPNYLLQQQNTTQNLFSYIQMPYFPGKDQVISY